jgi:pterin-4a-carbinolamine dehydratase
VSVQENSDATGRREMWRSGQYTLGEDSSQRELLQERGQDHLHLKAIPNWEKQAQILVRTCTHDGFLQSIYCVNASYASEKNHYHSDIEIRFKKVT